MSNIKVIKEAPRPRTIDLERAFEIFQAVFENDRERGKYLFFTPQRYGLFRTGKARIHPRIADYFCLKAEKLIDMGLAKP